MELDDGGKSGGSASASAAAAAGVVEAGGDAGVPELQKKNISGGETKVKRKMKTASQLEVLEKAYAGEFILYSVYFT